MMAASRALALFLAFAAPLAALAQADAVFPNKLVRIVVPLPAGGQADVIARQIALQLSPQWDQAVIVENRPGSNTIAAADFVAKAPADGHTILSRHSRNQTGNEQKFRQHEGLGSARKFRMFRRFASALDIPAYAGSSTKNLSVQAITAIESSHDHAQPANENLRQNRQLSTDKGLMATDSTMSINPHLYAKLPYDPARDFAPVTQLIFVSMQLVAHPSVPANNLAELAALAKAKPGTLNYASYGSGSVPHLAMEMLKSQAGIDIVHIPYKGTADAIPATVGGQVQFTFSGLPSALPHVKAGRLKALAIGGSRRSPLAPEVPTFAEQGYPEVNSHAWFGLFVPAGTPREAISRIHRDVVRIISDPAFRDRYITNVGMDLVASSPEEFAQFLSQDRASHGRAVQVSGARNE